MRYNHNGKLINIPDKEIQNFMVTLDLTEQEAIEMYLDDNGYTTNEVVEELTKKAKTLRGSGSGSLSLSALSS